MKFSSQETIVSIKTILPWWGSNSDIAVMVKMSELRKSMRRYHTISSSHPCLEGHFPENPMVPGALLLDEIVSNINRDQVEYVCVGLSKVKFIAPVPIETEFTIEVEDVSADCWNVSVYRQEEIYLKGRLDVVVKQSAN